MSETHPGKAVAYLLIGLILETVFPILAIIYMDQIIAWLSGIFGFPPFSISMSDFLIVYIVVFGVIFAFIAFGRGYFTKHTRKYAIFDCIGSIFSIIGYVIIVGLFSGGQFGHFYFSLGTFSIDINIYMIYVITIVLYILMFIVKFAAITEAEPS
ncbi:MAG: hypothetical protein GF329_19655 [Candidatus Lokiarchaeota archaeon]|nr:hypothetical protein [Candidatus Lokiarchaeota archaeon]